MNHDAPSNLLGAAAHLAVRGHYCSALTLLDQVSLEERPAAVGLLRAKVLAQQGLYDAAITCWKEVLQMEPTNAEARQGIEIAEQLKGRPAHRFYLRANLYYSLLLLVIVGLAVAMAFVLGRDFGRKQGTSARDLLDAQDRQLQLSRELVEAQSQAAAKSEEYTREMLKRLEQRFETLAEGLDATRREQQDAAAGRRKELRRFEDQVAGMKTMLTQREEDLEKLMAQTRQDVSKLSKHSAEQTDRLVERLASLEKTLALVEKSK